MVDSDCTIICPDHRASARYLIGALSAVQVAKLRAAGTPDDHASPGPAGAFALVMIVP